MERTIIENDGPHRDISASILQNVLQIGHLDYAYAMTLLKNLTQSKTGFFFEKVQTGALFLCKYSDTEHYVVDDRYTLDTLPTNQYTIFHRNNVIAILSIENQDALDDIADDLQQRVHDSICIGLVMGTLRESKYSFTISVCNALGNLITQVIEMFDNLTTKVKSDQRYIDQINRHLNEVISIIYDTIDYLEIDAEKVQLQKNVVNLREFMNDVISQYERIFRHKVNVEIQDAALGFYIFDKRWVQQMLISLLKKIVDVPNIQIHISVSGNILVFRIYSTTSRSNAEILRILQVDRMSVTSLDVFIVKRLCEIMQGRFEVGEEGASITITVQRSEKP